MRKLDQAKITAKNLLLLFYIFVGTWNVIVPNTTSLTSSYNKHFFEKSSKILRAVWDQTSHYKFVTEFLDS